MGATITVNCGTTTIVVNTSDSGPGSLREAIDGACPGGTIFSIFQLPIRATTP